MVSPSNTFGRYTVHGEIATGGMATVHIAQAEGHGGFVRTVAVKRLHPHLASHPEFVAMFLDEARLAARIHHPNVVQTIDIVNEAGELSLVMDYLEGETLSRVWRALREGNERTPVPILASILCGVLYGLHAAHEAKDEAGKPLNIVHRDVSPQNIMVGVDGVARVLDFGVAKAAVRMQSTRDGQLKGKLAYMAPEQFEHEATRSSDIYAASIVAWEGLTGKRLFQADSEGQMLALVMHATINPPSSVPETDPVLDAIVMRGLSRAPSERFATAREMALAIERSVEIARASQVGDWLERVAGKTLRARAQRIAELLGRAAPRVSRAPAPEPNPQELGSQMLTLVDESRSSPNVVNAPSSSGSLPSFTSSASFTPGSSPSLTSSSRPSTTRALRRRVLIIDDSEVVLSKVKAVLEGEGYEVVATSQTVGNARYLVDTDLVIIDYHMPGLDGAAVISSLRAAAASKKHPCLFYLYTQDPTVAKTYATLGFDGAFTQKGDEKALVRQVQSAFRMLQMRAMHRSGPGNQGRDTR
jgi:serine/threonine protein kinase